MTLSSKQWSVSLVSAVAVAALIGGLAATNASAQGADTKKVTVKKGPLTITMPAVVNVRAKACVSVPYEYKIDGSAAPQSLSLFVRDKSGSAMAGQSLVLPPPIVSSLEQIEQGVFADVEGKGVLRFCGQPQRSTLKFGGPWAAAVNGKQSAQGVLITNQSGASTQSDIQIPFQLNVVKRK
jgi:hypothetical protein